VPKVSEHHLEARREEILGAAIACFARNGFHQTTMSDIAREAGISPGAIYRYFASKEDVILASAEARRQARAARFEAAEKKGGSLEVLDEVVHAYLARADRPDPIVRLGVQLFGEALHNSSVRETILEGWEDVLARIAEIVSRAQAQGEINAALEPQVVALVVMAAVEGLAVHKTIDPDVDVWKYSEVLKALYSGDFWRGDGRTEQGDGQHPIRLQSQT
jgi:AcrR family transcriptional regulator